MFRKIRSTPAHKPRGEQWTLCGEETCAALRRKDCFIFGKAKDKFVRIEYRNDFRGKAEKDNGVLLDYYKGKAIYKHGPRHGEKARPVCLEERRKGVGFGSFGRGCF